MANKEDSLNNIEKLTDEGNYEIWKFQISIFFKAKQIYDIATGKSKCPSENKEEWEKKDAIAQRIIVTTIDKKVLMHLINCSSANEMFDKIKLLFERDNQQQKYNLLQEFYKYDFKSGSNISTHICELESLAHKLNILKQNISETMIITKILTTLPEKYRYFISAWESTPEDKQKLTELTSRLLAEEKRNKNHENSNEQQEAAFSSTGEKNKNFKRGFTNKNSDKTCFKCGKAGHFARECKRAEIKCNICKKTNHVEKDCFFRNKTSGNKGKSNEKTALLTTHEDMSNDKNDEIEFFLDSGATSHMINKKLFIQNMKEKVIEIKTAKKGETIQALGFGEIETEECILKDVQYAPNLSKNLLSVNKITQNGGEVHFKNNTVEIYKNDIKIVEGKRGENELYKIKLNKSGENALVSETENIENWHKKLGHTSNKNMLKLKSNSVGLNLSDSEIKNFKNTTCEVCIKAKQTRKPFSEIRQRATRPLEIIHTDVCGPLDPTWDDKKYFITFLDDYTHFCTIKLLNGKHETFNAVKEFVNQAEAKWNLKSSIIRCDNGGEYKSNHMMDWCKTKGIQMDFTIPYSPQLNGKAERLNRTIMDKARALIFETIQDKTMWGEAVQVAVFLINRTPTKTVKTTPYQMWYDKKPNLKYLQIFGISAYAKKLGHLKKLEERSKKFIFVGYAPNGYRLFDKENKKIVISRDVIFEKHSTSEIKINEPESSTFENKNLEWTKVIETDSEDESDEEQIMDENQTESENEEPEPIEELRRGKRKIKLPEKFNDYAMLTYNEAITGKDKIKWRQAIEEEKNSLKENKTWTLVNKSETNNKNILSNKWVFKIKENGSYKARLVVRGFEQQKGIDYDETFSPVISSCAIRIIFAIAAERNAKIIKFDIKSAFLYGTLDEEIYMHLPQGYEDNNQVCKLDKSLYGLKQASMKFNEKFTTFLKTLGMEQLKSERCIFKTKNGNMILAIYVDDGLLIGQDDSEMNIFLEKLKENFKITVTKNPKNFLGIDIKHDETGIMLSQTEKVKQILQNYNMQDCNSTKIPLNNSDTKRSDKTENKKFPYREVIGSLLYLNNKTRPDLSFSINFASRYMESPTKSDVDNVKHIMRYLKGNENLGIKFTKNCKNCEIIAYSDADFAGDLDTRKSTTGYLVFYNNGLINWTSRKQPIVAMSTMESEFIAAADCTQNLTYIKNFIEEIKCEPVKITLKVDNKSAIELAKNGVINKRSKHIDVRYHYIHDKIKDGTLKLEHCSTSDQIADIMTKALDRIKFQKFRDLFMQKC